MKLPTQYMIQDPGIQFLIKVIGALCGSFLSLSVLVPDSKRDAFFRLVSGFISGVVFSAPVMKYFELDGWEYMLSVTAGVGFAGWFVFGVIARTAMRWRTIEDVAKTAKDIKKSL